MRRLARHLFTILSALSLLLFLAVCVLWVRSYWVADVWVKTHITPSPARHRSSIRSVKGTLVYLREDAAFVGRNNFSRWQTVPPGEALYIWDPQLLEWEFLGIAYYRMVTTLSALYVPYWMPFTSTTVFPILWLDGWMKRRRRVQRGLCPTCGYDLRASPERCPECGTIAPF